MVDGQLLAIPEKQLSIKLADKKEVRGKLQNDVLVLGHQDSSVPLRLHSEEEKAGHWIRRRRLDGALNRVPPDLYSQVWHVLERVRGQGVARLPTWWSPHSLPLHAVSGDLHWEPVLATDPHSQ